MYRNRLNIKNYIFLKIYEYEGSQEGAKGMRMMRDLSETDFGDILCLEWVEKLAQLIRRELNLWVGFVGRDGRHQWVGGEVVDKPLCEMFLLKNEEPTCFASYRGWLDEASSVSMPLFMECHAGLRGVIAPVRAWGDFLRRDFCLAMTNAVRGKSSIMACRFSLTARRLRMVATKSFV